MLRGTRGSPSERTSPSEHAVDNQLGKLMSEQQTFLEAPAPGWYEVPAGAAVERCRSCGTSIVWGSTAAGKAVPLNTDLITTIAGKRYGLTHFATCPHGRSWRRNS